MKTKYIILLSILFYNCSDTKEEEFLKKFKEKEQFNYSTSIKLGKEINNNDLYILNKSEALNEFEFDIDKKYHYGYKKQISNDCYLLSYVLGYKLLYNHPFTMYFGFREYWCLYQKGV